MGQHQGLGIVSLLMPDIATDSAVHSTYWVENWPRTETSAGFLHQLLFTAGVRSAGYAGEDGEVTPGLASVAAAVHDHIGRPVAGAAVTFPAEQLDAAARRQLARRVTAAAGELTRRIGGLAP